MSYSHLMFDYPYHTVYEDDSEVDYWPERRPSQYISISRNTVNPTQLIQQPRTYEPSRSYSSNPRHQSSNRHHENVVYVSQPVLPNTSLVSSPRAIDDYEYDRQSFETPQIMVECRTRPSKSQRYYCEFETCVDPETGVRRSVSRRADLKRHVHSVHGRPNIDCEYKKCWRRGEDGFCRPDHYREHLRGYHNQELPRSTGRRRDS